MKVALKEIYKVGVKSAKLKKNDYVLDIGANDGTLLNYFKKNKIKTIGCEPAKNLKKEILLRFMIPKKNKKIKNNDFEV